MSRGRASEDTLFGRRGVIINVHRIYQVLYIDHELIMPTPSFYTH